MDAEQQQRFLAAAERARQTRLAEADRVKADNTAVGGRTKARFSSVSDDGTCPKCGGSAFRAKRSRLAKVALIPTVGVGTLLAPKSRVKCVTCGTEYLRA